MKMKRNIVFFAAVLGSIFLCGCSQEKERVDDFYEMVNGQWVEENQEHPGFYYGALQEQQEKVEQLLDDYLKDLSEQQASENIVLSETEQKAVILYEQATDWKMRNELGAAPIQEMLEQVEQVSDLEGLITLYKDEKMSFFNMLYGFLVEKDQTDGSYQVKVYPRTICGQYGMLTEEQFEGYKYLVKQEAVFAGYEEQRAEEIAEHAVMIEREILALDYYNLMDFSRYANKGMEAVLDRLPLEEIAKEQGYLEERITLTCSAAHLKLLQELFVEENTESLKDYLLAAIIIKSAPYLNEEMALCYESAVNALMGSSEVQENTYEGYQVVKEAMEDFLAEYYMEQYVGAEMEQEVRDMAEEIKEELKEKINAADWMCETTKAYAVEKLDAMSLFVGVPEKLHDYSKLKVETYEEGGSLIENLLYAYVNDCDFQKERLKEESEKAYYFHPLEVNASYAPLYNAFAINAAIITLDDCNENTKYEERLAVLGFTIAHEISHGFDGMGSNFSAEGIYENWWTAEDKAAYRERINQVKHYFEGMEVEDGLVLVGANVMDEAYADLSAMSVCMDLMEKKGDCDYKLFFEAYARTERTVQTEAFYAYLVSNDSHLPGKVRVNQVVGQMDEFYQTYNVPEDGRMYVKEEDRLRIWE